MTREELARLSRDELIEVVLRLRQTIAGFPADLEQVRHRISELEEQLRRPAKTPENSSVPPSQGQKANQPPADPSAPARGPKNGHRGATRAASAEPTMRVELRVPCCGCCGADLAAVEQTPTERRQVVELPPVKPVVIEAVAHQALCPQCGETTVAPFPPAFPAPQSFGPRVQATVSYLHEVHHVAYGRLRTLLGELWGLSIAAGSLINLVRRTGEALAVPAAAIRELIRSSPVIGSDETPMRVNGRTWWLWTFQTPAVSYYRIRRDRSAEAIKEVLGETQVEAWVSDLFSAQLCAPAQRFHMCLAHQLRDLQWAIDCGDTPFAPALQELLQAALSLAAARPTIDATIFAHLHQVIEAACDALLAVDTPNAEGDKLQRRYRRHRDKLFLFLERADVPPTNNGSERAVRTAAVHRKVMGGFRSEWAPSSYSALLSVVETAKKQRQSILEVLLQTINRPLPSLPTACPLPAEQAT